MRKCKAEVSQMCWGGGNHKKEVWNISGVPMEKTKIGCISYYCCSSDDEGKSSEV